MSERRQYHHGDLRGALLRVARRVLHEEGVAALSVRRLAAEVGVSASAPYRHFRDADDVLAAVAAEGFERLQAAIAPLLAGQRIPALRDVGTAYVREAIENPGTYAVMFSPGLAYERHPGLAAAAQAAFEQLVDAVVRTTGFPPEEARPRAFAFWVTMHGYADLALQDRTSLLGGNEALKEVVEGAAAAAARPR